MQDDTPEARAETLTSLLDDHAARTAMGRAARDRVEHHYADWLTLFRTCLRPLWLEAAAAASEPKPICA